ncbi:MAG: hypothetical protein JO366_19820 [Methylobacteriaceae bacterium]|nr:hypothetical protein [Methylobacteriaceae bacterium]MBV9218926.1 hypothetical protein [Methylobacteriaceae bacterium]MBV9247020.1 hypothetical protein [Methylobacteriaceae bacterium]MBV9247051.1 hypothetical protein [Methylobacteriaceae bacterium]MBV9633333.1 hypothetical protein [Methylobacteriaceae bacterium]
MITFKKTVAASLAALTLAFGIAASSTPASAFWKKPGGAFVGGLIGGLALGAIAAGAAASEEGDCYVTRQRVYDDYGNFMGYRPVQVCN